MTNSKNAVARRFFCTRLQTKNESSVASHSCTETILFSNLTHSLPILAGVSAGSLEEDPAEASILKFSVLTELPEGNSVVKGAGNFLFFPSPQSYPKGTLWSGASKFFYFLYGNSSLITLIKNIYMNIQITAFLLLLLFLNCNNSGQTKAPATNQSARALQTEAYKNNFPVMHVFVALCDNKYQGIVPVPAAIGNGQDADNNLYWGCDYGIKTFFKNKTNWTLVQSIKNPAPNILERCVFKNKTTEAFMIADAYDGAYIKKCTEDFLSSCAGGKQEKIILEKDTIGIGGNAKLLAYIGHDGLMDFTLDSLYKQQDRTKRECVILACKSKQFFRYHIQQAGAIPLLWTTELMCPEAYTLDAAIDGWLQNKSSQQIHALAAAAYSRYQHCSIKAAGNLLVTGY